MTERKTKKSGIEIEVNHVQVTRRLKGLFQASGDPNRQCGVSIAQCVHNGPATDMFVGYHSNAICWKSHFMYCQWNTNACRQYILLDFIDIHNARCV